MSEDKPFKAFDHGTGQIDLRHHEVKMLELRPLEIHHKSNGTITGGPVFGIVMGIPKSDISPEERIIPEVKNAPMIYGQISLEMLNEGLEELGYKIIKIEK